MSIIHKLDNMQNRSVTHIPGPPLQPSMGWGQGWPSSLSPLLVDGGEGEGRRGEDWLHRCLPTTHGEDSVNIITVQLIERERYMGPMGGDDRRERIQETSDRDKEEREGDRQ